MTTAALPRINEDARKMLDLIMAELPPGLWLEIARINGGPPKVKAVRTLAAAIAYVSGARENEDVYFAPGARTSAVKVHGATADVGAVLSAWADCDDGEPEWDSTFVPSIVIASGTVTPAGQPRVQAHWLLREPFEVTDARDRTRIVAINQELARRYGGDAVQSVEHLMRMPGTKNWCRKANGELKPLPDGVVPPLWSSIMLWNTEQRYNPSDLEEWLGLDPDADGGEKEYSATFTDAQIDANAALQLAIDAGISDETTRMIGGWIPDELLHDRSRRDQKIIYRLLEVDLDDDQIRAIFQSFGCGDRYAEKGQGDRYLNVSIASSRKLRATQPNLVIDVEASASEVNVGDVPTPERYPGPRLPAIAWKYPFDVYRVAVADSTEAADEHHFAAFRIVAGSFLGRLVRVHYGRLHYLADYALLIGPTHDKKTTSQRRAADFAAALKPSFGMLGALSSAEGFVEWLAKQDMTSHELGVFLNWMKDTTGKPWVRFNPTHRRGLLISEEFASVLQKARTDGGSSLVSTLTSVYDAPSIIEPPLRAKRMVAERPTFSILGASTPDWIARNLKETDILGGFGNRFMYFTGPAKEPMPWPPKPDEQRLAEVATHLIEKYKHWESGAEFTLHEHAHELWNAFYLTWAKQQREEGDLPTSKLESRIPEHAIKLALLYAALGGTGTIIGPHYMEAAIAVADYLRASVRYAFADTLDTGESPVVKLERAVLKVLGEGPTKKRELQQRAKQRHTTASDFARVLDGLTKSRTATEDQKTGIVRLRND